MKRLLWLLLALAVAQGATADHHEKEEVPEAIRLLRSAAGPLQSRAPRGSG